jgi:hypothetical protein
VKLWQTVWAAYVALPACEACRVQVPGLIMVATVPETVHMSVVNEAKVTGNWELAEAASSILINTTSPVMGLNVMVWVASTVKLWFTGWAGA